MTIAFASFVVFAPVLGFQETQKMAALTLNGGQTNAKAHEDTISNLFVTQDVIINSNDYLLFPVARIPFRDNKKIFWKEVRQVQIVKDNEKKTVWTTADTVAELLKGLKIVVHEHDKITPKPRMPIKNMMKINLRSAHHLTLVDGGNQREVWSTSTTVADFLKQQGIRLNVLDRVEPSLEETVKENGRITIIRVEKVTDVVEEPIKFAVVTHQDASLNKGKTVIITEGRQGINSKKYEVTLVNGREVARYLISDMVVRNKQDKVVAVGTKVLANQVSRGQMSSGRDIYVRATAYTASCNGCSGRTATGINLYADPNAKVIAVDPRIIPLGSRVYVEGYGYATAADTGGAIKGYSIDVFFSSIADAYQWGARNVKITVLN